MGNTQGVHIDWSKVEYYMHKNGLSQRKLAAALGSSEDRPMSEQTIRNWKRGIKLPNVKSFSRLANVLGVSPRKIVSAEYAPPLDPVEDKNLHEVYSALDRMDRDLSMLSYAGYQCIDKYLIDWPGKDGGVSAYEFLQGIADKMSAREYTQDICDRADPLGDLAGSEKRHVSALNDFYIDEALPDDLQLIYEIRQPDGNILCVSADNLRVITGLILDAVASSFKNAAINLETPPGNASIYAE